MYSIVLILSLLCIYYVGIIAENTINDTLLSTSENICLSNYDCPSSEYCITALPRPDREGTTYTEAPVYKCAPRVRPGQRCYSFMPFYFPITYGVDAPQSCTEGHVCKRTNDNETCVREIPRGKVCQPQTSGDGDCTSSETCRKDIRGVFRCMSAQASRCRDDGCWNDGYINGCDAMCPKNRPPNAACAYHSDCLNGHCLGRKCQATQETGKLCRTDADCTSNGSPATDGDHVYCNSILRSFPQRGFRFYDSTLGRCYRESQLLKTLGAPCRRSRDRCDGRRGLMCVSSPSKSQSVCQQGTPLSFCTPNHPLSQCRGSDYRCTIARDTRSWTRKTSRFYRCNRNPVPVPLGWLCNRGNADVICPPGATCELISDVSAGYERINVSRMLEACVFLRDIGEKCENKFQVQCIDGLKCESGYCVRGEKPVTREYSDMGEPCPYDDVTCIPGTTCIQGLCLLPKKFVGLEELCGDAVFFRNVSIAPVTSPHFCFVS